MGVYRSHWAGLAMVGALLASSGQAQMDLVASWGFDEQSGPAVGDGALAVEVPVADGLRAGEGQNRWLRFSEGSEAITWPGSSAWAFDSESSFTIEFLMRTVQRSFATLLMTKTAPGGEVSWSVVIGRDPGHLSFELWSWRRVKLGSAGAVNDGEWHRVRAGHDAELALAWVEIDGELRALAQPGPGGPSEVQLRAGNNLDTHQPYVGDLDNLSIWRGTPPEVLAAVREAQAMEVLSPQSMRDQYASYLTRIAQPRPWRPADLTAWKARRDEIRERVLDDLGLWPLPSRGPVNVHWGRRMEREGYTVQRLYWESWPGYWAAGYLYRPDHIEGRACAVLNPHGHWENGNRHPIVQARLVNLALRGYVCLAPDSVHLYDWERGIMPQTVMTWNNIRAIDLLQSLPFVDPDRIGSAGVSGGAQQTFYLMAVDDRLKAAVPVCMVSKFRTILDPYEVHCDCNHVPGVAADTDAPEMAARMAPDPALIITVTGDWTATFPAEDLPQVQAVYGLYGAQEKLWATHHESGHDYNQAMREETYQFMDRWLRELPDAGPVAELDVPVPTVEELSALDSPPESDGLAAIAREFDLRRGEQYTRLRSLGTIQACNEQVRGKLLAWSRGMLAPPSVPGSTQVTEGQVVGLRTRMLSLAVDPDFSIPAMLVEPEGSTGPGPAVVVVHPEGKRLAWSSSRRELHRVVAGGGRVLLLDPRWMGECAGAGPKQTLNMNGVILGCPAAVEGARDMLAAVAWLRAQPGVDPARVSLLAWSDAGVLALIAAAMDTNIQAVDVRELGPTYSAGRSGPRAPHILSVMDLPHLAAMVAPRPLSITGVPDPLPYRITRDVYREAQAAGAVRVERTAQRPVR